MKTAIIALTRGGAELGARFLVLPDSTLYVPGRLPAVGETPRTHAFDVPVAELVAGMFGHCQAFVFIMAAGIVVRTIAPLIRDKTTDPAVVVVDERGRFAVSLLSGHLGGANSLARRVADITGGQAVITTATDVNDLPAIDLIAQGHGWVIENVEAVRTVNAAIVNGGLVAVYDATGNLGRELAVMGPVEWEFFGSAADCLASEADAWVIADTRVHDARGTGAAPLFLRPRNLVVGLGCNRDTTSKEIEQVFYRHLMAHGLAPLSVKNLASINLKEDEAGLLEFAKEAGLDVSFYTPEELNTVDGVESSDYLMKTIGVKGVCEPAAILSAGNGRLLVKKIKDGNVTMAVAEVLFSS